MTCAPYPVDNVVLWTGRSEELKEVLVEWV